MVLALVLAASAASPRVLIVGTRFDELDDAARVRLVQAAEEAFIATRCTVRVSDCRDEACAAVDANTWRAGAIVVLSAARLGRDVSVAFRATASGKDLSRGDALVDIKKLGAVTVELEKFSKAVRPQIPITAAPDAPLAADEPPPGVPAAQPAEAPVHAEATEGVEPPPTRSYAGAFLVAAAVAFLVGSVVCLALAGGNDGKLGAARSEGTDGIGRWSLTRGEADGLRNAVRIESALGGSFAAGAAVAALAAFVVW